MDYLIPHAEEAMEFVASLKLHELPINIILPGNKGWERVEDIKFDEIGFPIVVTANGESYVLPHVLLELNTLLGG